MYSDDDASGKSIAKACETRFKGKKKDDKYRFTAAVPITGGGKLIGAGLLQKSLGTDNAIVEYIQGVAEAKGNEWSEREFRKSQYVWRASVASQLVPAKAQGENNLNFSTYAEFMR